VPAPHRLDTCLGSDYRKFRISTTSLNDRPREIANCPLRDTAKSKNGADAKGVDYARLTALLIEATKEQQGQIRQEQALRQAAERHEAEAIARVEAMVDSLKLQIRADAEALQEMRGRFSATRQGALPLGSSVTFSSMR
jgi:hypothetical protein